MSSAKKRPIKIQKKVAVPKKKNQEIGEANKESLTNRHIEDEANRDECDRVHDCDQCCSKYPTLVDLVHHIEKKHKGRQCDKCHKRFRSFSTLKNHQIRIHNYNQVCISETYGYKTKRWTQIVEKEIKVNVTKNLRTYKRSSKPKIEAVKIKDEPEYIIPD